MAQGSKVEERWALVPPAQGSDEEHSAPEFPPAPLLPGQAGVMARSAADSGFRPAQATESNEAPAHSSVHERRRSEPVSERPTWTPGSDLNGPEEVLSHGSLPAMPSSSESERPTVPSPPPQGVMERVRDDAAPRDAVRADEPHGDSRDTIPDAFIDDEPEAV